MAVAVDTPLALANRFKVTVTVPNELELGSWAKAEGLDVQFDFVEYRAGDNWNERWYSPGATKYKNVTLTRTVHKEDTVKVRKWLSDTAKKHVPGDLVIILFDSAGVEVTNWELRSAMPVHWNVTGFDASTGKLATETLEIAHMGFLDDEKTL